MGAVCFDEQPDEIVTRLGRRDQWIIKETDWIHLTLDSNHDRQTAYSFFITAGGTVIDGVYFNDDRETYTWDGVFESHTRVGEQGWTAEVRIPFHNFRFTGADSTWGLQIDRYTSRLKENSFWVPLGVQDEGFVSRFGDLRGIRDVSPETALEVRPHLVGRSIFRPRTSGRPGRARIPRQPRRRRPLRTYLEHQPPRHREPRLRPGGGGSRGAQISASSRPSTRSGGPSSARTRRCSIRRSTSSTRAASAGPPPGSRSRPAPRRSTAPTSRPSSRRPRSPAALPGGRPSACCRP